MGKATFEQLVGSALEGVDLSSRKPDKFDVLVAALGDHWDIEPTAVGVKALGDAKNYGNRVGEATRTPLEVLVLLSEQEVDIGALARAVEGRALRIVPTVVVVKRNEHWEVDAVLLGEDAVNRFEFDVQVRTIRPRAPSDLSSEDLERITTRLMEIEACPPGTEIEPLLDGLSVGGRGVISKRVTELKNLSNRISEAIGRRPSIAIIRVPQELVDPARRVLRDQLGSAAETRGFLVYQDSARYTVEHMVGEKPERLVADQAPTRPFDVLRADEQMPPAETSTEPTSASEPRYRELERVRQLRRHLPLDANADRLYEEHQEVSDRLAYETKTLAYLRHLLASPERAFVVLTGNAGHGKTHMCRRLLEGGHQNTDVMTRLCDDLVGGTDWVVDGASRPVRVVKDLSEISPPEYAGTRLESLLQQEHAHVIVCANEGRLRDVVGRNPTHLAPLLAALEQGLERGETSPPGRADVHVLNLNYQAAAGDGGGFLRHVLDHFLNHENAWKVCRSCAAQKLCPIVANRDELAQSPSSPATNAVRRDVLTEFIRVAEEGGYVLTFRETLKFVAYIITGGLSCNDVEVLHRKRRVENLENHRILPLLFEADLSEDEAEVLPLLARLRRMDPGCVALRPVDEHIHADLEELGVLGTGLFEDASRQLHKKSERKKEERDHRTTVRRARRRAWLESLPISDGVRRATRLGLRHHHLFRSLQEKPEVATVIATMRGLVRGLHTIQGAVGVDSMSSLHLVDPAFGRSGSHSAVIARSLRIKDLDLWTESNWWRELRDGGEPPILDCVEWIDRRLVLVDRREQAVLLALDLLAFEFVMNAGNGIVMREFHSAERRRILRTLARHAERGRDSNDDIRVLVGRGEGRLTVERDDTILLEKS